VNLFGHFLEQARFAAVPVNAGVGGYGALEEAWTAETYSRRVETSLVVENLYLNDVNGDPRRVMAEAGVPSGSYHDMFSSLGRLVRHCNHDGLPVVICVIPDKEQFARGRSARHFQERVGRWCAEHGVPFLDAFPYLKQHGADANYFAWDPHLNERGHRAYAEFLFGQLRPLLETRFAHRS
jgi:lysophospholipase L1-like esterase